MSTPAAQLYLLTVTDNGQTIQRLEPDPCPPDIIGRVRFVVTIEDGRTTTHPLHAEVGVYDLHMDGHVQCLFGLRGIPDRLLFRAAQLLTRRMVYSGRRWLYRLVRGCV